MKKKIGLNCVNGVLSGIYILILVNVNYCILVTMIIKIKTFDIKVSNNEKIFGTYIGEKLLFNGHIFNCVKKANNVCHMLFINT